MSMSETTGQPSRHRADDDVEALASGAFTPVVSSPPPTPNPERTSNGITDLLSGDGDGDDERVVNGRTDAIRVDRAHSDISDSDEEHPLTAADVLGSTESTIDDDDIDENEPLELNYESEDDDDVSVGSAAEGAAELSKRTSDLMDSFRNYVGEMASPSEEETAVGGGVAIVPVAEEITLSGTTGTLSETPVADSVQVFDAGVLKRDGGVVAASPDYTISGTTITKDAGGTIADDATLILYYMK